MAPVIAVFAMGPGIVQNAMGILYAPPAEETATARPAIMVTVNVPAAMAWDTVCLPLEVIVPTTITLI